MGEIKDINDYRAMLFSIAYNMLGTISDAEDMVQETFISWLSTDKSHVENQKFYLIRTISNKCITHLKKLKQQREVYTGTWLPEPLLSVSETENSLVTDKNLSIGFLYLLEKLTPIERGVIILKEAFDLDYQEISKIFEITNEATRQHLSRAKKKVQLERNRFQVDKVEHEEILKKFLDACLNKQLEDLVKLLRKDVIGYGDGGGKASAMLNPVEGFENVAHILIAGIGNAAPFARIEIMTINGLSGAALYKNPTKTPDTLIAIETDENKKITGIYFLANPDKLQHVNQQNFN